MTDDWADTGADAAASARDIDEPATPSGPTAIPTAEEEPARRESGTAARPGDATGPAGGDDGEGRPPWWQSLLIALALFLVAGLLVGAGLFTGWTLSPIAPGDDAKQDVKPGRGISVDKTDAGLVFTARPGAAPKIGLVLYPAAHVDPVAYSTVAREVAAAGYAVIVPTVKLTVPAYDVDAATPAQALFPGIKTWAVGGHAEGGAAASMYVARHPGRVSGLVLLAAIPPPGTDLSKAKGPTGDPLAVLSIRGSNDKITTSADIAEGTSRLPADTEYVTIEGGVHAQFGDYGNQDGDGVSTIKSSAQQEQTAEAIIGFLEGLPQP